MRVVRDPAPVRSADAAREVQGGAGRRSFRAVDPGGERAGAVDLAQRLDQLGARRGMLRRGVVRGHQVGGLVGDAAHRRRLHRERLRRVRGLAGHVAGRDRAILHAEDRLAVLAVQDVQVARLGGHAEGRDGAPVLLDIEQHRRRGRVGVPQVVADGLEVPAVLAAVRIDSHHGVAVQVGALAVAAVGAGNGRRQRQVQQAAVRVRGEVERPGVGAQPALPAFARPGVVAHVARLRHGVELPQRRAAARIVGAGVADAADRAGRRVRADHHDVAEDERHGVVRHAELDDAAGPEFGHGRAGRYVYRVQVQAGGEEDARRLAVAARPPGDAAPGGRALRRRVAPALRAGGRIQRDYAVGRRQVHDALDDDGRGLRARPARRSVVLDLGAQRIAPRLRQTGDVLRVQLRERRVAGAGGVGAVQRPVAGGRNSGILGRRRGRTAAAGGDRRQRGQRRRTQPRPLHVRSRRSRAPAARRVTAEPPPPPPAPG